MTATACAVWDFRSNESNFDVDTLTNWLNANCKKWTFQKEQGDTGYVHWQGRFSLIKKRLKSVVLKMQPGFNYLEPTATFNHLDEFFYAMKEDTRLDGPWRDQQNTPSGSAPVYIPRQYRDIQL